MKQGKSLSVYLTFRIQGKELSFTLPELMEKLGVKEKPDELILGVEQKKTELMATVYPYEADYPSINVDGRDANGTMLWLTNTELPNETWPNSITARLYAGYDFEYDSPIAMTHTNVKETVVREHLNMAKSGRLTKIVYVDTETSQFRPWNEDRPMPEHMEDE